VIHTKPQIAAGRGCCNDRAVCLLLGREESPGESEIYQGDSLRYIEEWVCYGNERGSKGQIFSRGQ